MGLPSSLPHRIHLIGIGGVGMLGLAECLTDLGHNVSGSDLRSSDAIAELVTRGVTFVCGHGADNIAGAQIIVRSDAIPPHNPELLEARLRNIPIIRRAECLDLLGQTKQSIFVAGTHGKSTTTAMIATVLNAADYRPSFCVGAKAATLQNRSGFMRSGVYFVAEACEAFQNLGALHPDMAVITNIDDDHLEHYGSQAKLDKAFLDFAARTSYGGKIIVNGDDAGVKRLLPDLKDRVVTFGFHSDNDVSVGPYEFDASGSRFDLRLKGEPLGDITLPVPGKPAIANALASIAACLSLGVSFEKIARGLSEFTGVARRWDDYGTVSGVRLVDDYAHHPAALKASLETARALCKPGQKLVVAFQPQLFSRTRRLYKEFADALKLCELALILEIEPSGESNSEHTSAQLVVDALRARGSVAHLVTDADELVSHFREWVSPGDFLLIAGAGPIRDVALRLQNVPVLPLLQNALSVPTGRSATWQPSLVRRLLALPGGLARAATVLAMFEKHALWHPGKKALSNIDRDLTYGQLEDAAERVAEVLQEHGIKHGTIVGVSLPSSIDLITVLLAVMKLGAVYLPLDPSLPRDRVAYILDQAKSQIVISNNKLKYDSLPDIVVLRLEDIQSGLDKAQGRAPRLLSNNPTANDIAYICFTSGSTGYPKGVAVRHRGLRGLIGDIVERFGISSETRTAVNTSISFDVSLGEIWMTLAGGGCLCVTDAHKPLIGQSLATFIGTQRVSHLAVTPSVMATVPQLPLKTLTHIIAAGEACPQELVENWGAARSFFNAYGPTEATVYATAARCTPGSPVSIGQALGHIRTFILDENLCPVHEGKEGELCLGGRGVADGYYNIAQSNDAKFVFLRRPRQKDEWLYRTGDIVKMGDDGNLYFLGRRDHQIKINGNRVEIEEIEQTIVKIPGVKDVAVCFMENLNRKELIAFIVAAKDQHFDAAAIRERMTGWLPDYMIPASFERIEKVPLTPSGKKDRQRLLASRGTITRADYVAPESDVEITLAAVWQKILEPPNPVGLYDNFYALGGDSLRHLLIIEEIEDRFGLTVPPGTFGHFTTITVMGLQIRDLLSRADPIADQQQGFRGSRIYKQLRELTATWGGSRVAPEALIVSVGSDAPLYELFVCVQMDEEVAHLAKNLGKDFRVHGMRSGHLVMTYSDDNVEALSNYYLEEMAQLRCTGDVILAGICQGGTIAHAMANKLGKTAGHYPPLVLIEQARFIPYDSNVAFFYSEESFLNPYRRFDTAIERYDQIYGGRYTLDIMPGIHGRFHVEPGVSSFVSQLRIRLAAFKETDHFNLNRSKRNATK